MEKDSKLLCSVFLLLLVRGQGEGGFAEETSAKGKTQQDACVVLLLNC